MVSKSPDRVALGLLLALTAFSAVAADVESNPVSREPRAAATATSVGVIFKLRSDGAGASIAKLTTGTERMQAVAKRSGLSMSLRRDISGSLLASTVDLGDASADQVLERLRADP